MVLAKGISQHGFWRQGKGKYHNDMMTDIQKSMGKGTGMGIPKRRESWMRKEISESFFVIETNVLLAKT